MTNVDQFESMFRSASREVFRHERVNIESVLVVTDRDEQQAKLFGDQVRRFLSVLRAQRDRFGSAQHASSCSDWMAGHATWTSQASWKPRAPLLPGIKRQELSR